MQTVVAFNPQQSELIRRHRKEKSFWKQLSLIDMDEGTEDVCVRWYGSGETSYCCVWANAHNARGAGKAGGGGYHKASASMQAAMNDAGFRFADAFDGQGDGAIDDALLAIARWLDIPRPLIVKAHS